MILEMLLGGSALILAVFALRAVLGRRMGVRLRYALWLLVLLRLLLPVHLGQSAASPANLARVSAQSQMVYTVPLTTGQPAALGVTVGPDGRSWDANSFGYPRANADGTVTRYGWTHPLPEILPLVWKIGIGVAAAWYLLCNLLFYRGLRRTRKPLQTLGKIPVYVAKTPSPCLFGLFRPAIYVTAEAAQDPDTLSHVLLHEATHLRHGDQLWAFLRIVCLAVWWFDPLVYLAAAASRRDCELFCDDAVIRLLGEERRAAYGRTLLTLAGGKRRPVAASCAASTLSGGGKPLRQRICAIAKWAKPKKWAILSAAVLALLAGACAFSGASEPAVPDGLAGMARLTGSAAADEDGQFHFQLENHTSKTFQSTVLRRLFYDENGVPTGPDGDGYADELPVNAPTAPEGTQGLSFVLYGGAEDAAYVLCTLRSVTFEDGEIWENPYLADWIADYEGQTVDPSVLAAAYPVVYAVENAALPPQPESGSAEPDYLALFAALAEDPDNDILRQPLLDAGDGAVRYARDYLLSHPSCLDGLGWDDKSLPAVLYRFYMASLPPEAGMPLDTRTIGEYWKAYVDLACRTYPADSEPPENETWLPIWELGQAAENPYRVSWIDDKLQTIDGAYLGMPLDEARALLGGNLISDKAPSGVLAFRFLGAYYTFLPDADGVYRLSELWADAKTSSLPLCVKAEVGWPLEDVLSKYLAEAPPENYTEIQYLGQKGQPYSATLTRIDYATKACLLEMRGGTAYVQIEFNNEGLVSHIFCGYSERLDAMNAEDWTNDPTFATTDGVFLGMDYETALGMAGTPDKVYPEERNTRSFRAGGIFYGFDRFYDGSYRLTGYTADGDDAAALPFGLRRGQARADVFTTLGLDPSLKADGQTTCPGPDGSQWTLSQDIKYSDGLVRLQGTSQAGNMLTVTFGRDGRVWLVECDSLWDSLPYEIVWRFVNDPNFAGRDIFDSVTADDGAYGLLGAVLYPPAEDDLAYGVAFCFSGGADGEPWFYPVTFGPEEYGLNAEPLPGTFRYLGNGRVGFTLHAGEREWEKTVSCEIDGSGKTFRAEDLAPLEAAAEP